MVSILSIISANRVLIVQNLTPQSLRITAARLSDSGRPGFDLNNDSRVDAPSWFVSSMDIFTDTAAILN